jgi:hypothetical protein
VSFKTKVGKVVEQLEEEEGLFGAASGEEKTKHEQMDNTHKQYMLLPCMCVHTHMIYINTFAHAHIYTHTMYT